MKAAAVSFITIVCIGSCLGDSWGREQETAANSTIRQNGCTVTGSDCPYLCQLACGCVYPVCAAPFCGPITEYCRVYCGCDSNFHEPAVPSLSEGITGKVDIPYLPCNPLSHELECLGDSFCGLAAGAPLWQCIPYLECPGAIVRSDNDNCGQFCNPKNFTGGGHTITMCVPRMRSQLLQEVAHGVAA